MLVERTAQLQLMRQDRARDVEAAATAYLRMSGIVFGAWMWCRMLTALPAGHPLAAGKIAAADYYRQFCLPEAALWNQRAAIGAAVLDRPGAIDRA
jgi:hypothetical protein